MPTKIIAEFGGNPATYSWDMTGFCHAAQNCGATDCKIQLWRAQHFPAPERDSKRPLEFPREWVSEYARQARSVNLSPGASVCDAEACRISARHLDWIKLAAREQFNGALISAALNTGKPIYRSLSTLADYSPELFAEIHERSTVLYTVSRYPTPLVLALFAIVQAALYFGKRRAWGWSSHTRHWLDCALAVAIGATVIEKHFCLSRSNPEGGHSLTPPEFRNLVNRIRQFERR